VPLGEWIRERRRLRLERSSHEVLFRAWPDHRRLRRCLDGLTTDRGPGAREHALLLRDQLNEPPPRDPGGYYAREQARLLRSVFAQEPQLAARVRTWTDELTRRTPTAPETLYRAR
jgi:hypothetical protein